MPPELNRRASDVLGASQALVVALSMGVYNLQLADARIEARAVLDDFPVLERV